MEDHTTAMLPEVVKVLEKDFTRRRRDYWTNFNSWINNGGFEELLDDLSTGELSLLEHAYYHSVRPADILKWIKADPNRIERYNDALLLSADAIMEDAVRDAKFASSIDQISLNKTQMIINAKHKLAKTRVAGYTSKPEVNAGQGTLTVPVLVQFVTTGTTAKQHV